MAYRVEITERARADAEAIYHQIASESPRNAARWFNQLIEKTDKLSDFPLAQPLAPEARLLDAPLRQTFHGVYRIIFSVHQDTVFIHHIRRGRRLRLGESPPDPDER